MLLVFPPRRRLNLRIYLEALGLNPGDYYYLRLSPQERALVLSSEQDTPAASRFKIYDLGYIHFPKAYLEAMDISVNDLLVARLDCKTRRIIVKKANDIKKGN